MFSEINKNLQCEAQQAYSPPELEYCGLYLKQVGPHAVELPLKTISYFRVLELDLSTPQHAAERWGTAEERIGALAWRTDRQTDTKSSTRQPAVTGAYCRPTPVKLLLNDKTDFGELTAVMMLMALVIAAAAAAAQLCVKSQKVSKLNKIWLGITWVWICKTETGRKLS